MSSPLFGLLGSGQRQQQSGQGQGGGLDLNLNSLLSAFQQVGGSFGGGGGGGGFGSFLGGGGGGGGGAGGAGSGFLSAIMREGPGLISGENRTGVGRENLPPPGGPYQLTSSEDNGIFAMGNSLFSMLPFYGEQYGGAGQFNFGPLEIPLPDQQEPRYDQSGYTAALPRWNGRPLGFIDEDPGKRSFIEQILAGGPNVGDDDDALSQSIGTIIGETIGSIWGPIGQQAGKDIGRKGGLHFGSII